MFDVDKVPFFNIPDLSGFTLKPYVSHATPRIPTDSFVERQIDITEDTLADI